MISVVYTRNCTLHWFYPIGHAIRFNLYMQYAGYVYVDLKSNNCFEISDVSLITLELCVWSNINFNKQIPYCSASPRSKVCCKHQYGGLNVLYTSYRLVATGRVQGTFGHPTYGSTELRPTDHGCNRYTKKCISDDTFLRSTAIHLRAKLLWNNI